MDFWEQGFAVFAPEDATLTWAAQARLAGLEAVADPALAQWHQCEGTWFVGLDALPNDAAGAVQLDTGQSAPLAGTAVDFATAECGGWPALHRAQLSVTYPGYPRPRAGETEAGFRYRLNRDAAHVDGVLGVGTPKRRFVREPHQFILGIALSEASAEAAPLVIWEGSHRIMHRVFAQALAGADRPEEVDVTDVYVAARKICFDTCKRVEVPLPVGGAVLLHRMALHGVAPWQPQAHAAPEGRMIAYFRPEIEGGAAAWVAGG